MKDNAKLADDLDSAKDEIKSKQCKIINVHKSYDNLLASHRKLDHIIMECRSENNKLADMLEEKDFDLRSMEAKFGDLMERFKCVEGSEQFLQTKLDRLHNTSQIQEYIIHLLLKNLTIENKI